MDISLFLELFSCIVESEECELFIEFFKDIDKFGIYEILGLDFILELVGKLEYIFLVDYLIENFFIFNLYLVNDIILVVKDIFNDIFEVSVYMIMDFELYFEDDFFLFGVVYCSNISESSFDDNGSV